MYARQNLRRLTTALAIVGCLPAGIAHAQVDCPGDYQIVDYFKPATSDYGTFAFQGGFALSLCNRPHETYSVDQVFSKGCNNIDLKGYLFLPGGGGASPADAGGPIVSTRHDLPLIVFSGGSFPNDDDPNAVNPERYPVACHQGHFFTEHGFAYLEIVRRGYHPSTGENELLHKGNSLNYLANSSFEIHEAITFMRGLKNITGESLIDSGKVAVMGHSFGAITVLFYGDFGNTAPLRDACQCSEPLLIAKAKALIAPASQSWDSFDNADGVLDDDSPKLERLKRAAMNSVLPAYYLEPLNDASSRPAVVLGKAAGDRFLGINRSCRADVYAAQGPGDTSHTLARRIVDNCLLSGIEYQSALFPLVDLTPFPEADSAHGLFSGSSEQIAKWGPSVVEFFSRYGVK
jgi:hypothetical protein